MIFVPLLAVAFLGLADASARCSAVERAVWRNNLPFANAFEACSRQSFGMADATTTCLAGRCAGISRPCLTCFGDAAACGGANCAIQCALNSAAPECLTCISTHCFPAMLTCVGASDPSELPVTPGVALAPTAAAVVRTRARPAAVTTAAPVTVATTTAATTMAPATVAAVTVASVTTAAAVTVVPVTTVAAATVAVVTTEAPATTAESITVATTTQAPATTRVVSGAPATTIVSTTEVPTTDVATTESLATNAAPSAKIDATTTTGSGAVSVSITMALLAVVALL